MDNRIKKYLADILKAIDEIDTTLNDRGRNFNLFFSIRLG